MYETATLVDSVYLIPDNPHPTLYRYSFLR